MVGFQSTSRCARAGAGCLPVVLGLWMFASPSLADPPSQLPAPTFTAGPSPSAASALPRAKDDKEERKEDEKKGEKGDGEKKAGPPVSLVPPGALVLDLARAQAIAIERQPAIAAARTSLAAAVARKQAVDNLRVPVFLQRDLPIRREQATYGPGAAQAGVRQVELNTIYGVQFSYLSYLYARTQLAMAEDSLERLRSLLDAVEKAVKAAEDPEGKFITDLNRSDVGRIAALVKLAEGRREEAVTGADRALSALREATGLESGVCIHVVQDRLLDVSAVLDLNVLVPLALAHRPEVIQTAIAAKVSELEVACQEARRHSPSVRTFASASDIHVQPLPPGSYDERYSPAALAPEMPTTINGRQPDRVEQAKLYAQRAHLVNEKTRNLIRLEVEQAYYRCVEASRKLKKFVEGARLSDRALSRIRESITDFTEARPKIESLLNAALVGSQLQIGQNEARYQLLIALAGLERATAGAFCAGLEKAAQVSGGKAVTDDGKESKGKIEDNEKDPDDRKDPDGNSNGNKSR